MSHIPSYNSSIQLFINGVNFSMQAGDFIYFISGFSLGGFDYQDESNIRFLGEITLIGAAGNVSAVTVIYDSTQVSLPNVGDFIFFAKDKQVNISGLLGYYASVNFVNNSTKKAELFAIGSEISESSK
jgi:hypothetical protein